MNVEQCLIETMKASGIDTVLTLPCDRLKKLLPLIPLNFEEMPLTREETGVGMAAGLSLAGRRPALVIQSTGIGNSLTALCSLHLTYGLPLPVIASWRGVYKEGIPAQVRLGKALPRILEGAGIAYLVAESPADLPVIKDAIEDSFKTGSPRVILLSPKMWEGSTAREIETVIRPEPRSFEIMCKGTVPRATESRFAMIKGIAPYLQGRIVVSNIGVPSKELYAALDQPTNFYMLGSMGLATPIGIGLARAKPGREVVVLDGDGSILMNPNSLGMAAQERPPNLTIVCFDNAAHGSTGNQKTYSAHMDLELLAQAYGLKTTTKAATEKDLLTALDTPGAGPRFIQAPVLAQNADVPDIPADPVAIKEKFMAAIR